MPVHEHYDLTRFTSWRVGGKAERYYQPDDYQELIQFLKNLQDLELVTWLGLGSNVLIRNGGISGTVIHLAKTLQNITPTESGVRVESGTSCAKLAKYCITAGLQGSFLGGIPGTVGGALAMNAGAFGFETWRFVDSVEIMMRDKTIQRVPASEFYIGYRSVQPSLALRAQLNLNQWGFLAGYFRFPKTSVSESTALLKKCLADRKATQPIGTYNCGSVFKNPLGHHAARLIDQAGLKNFQCGQAKISDKHANFILNLGSATSFDIESLVHHIQDTVFKKFSIHLEPEFKTLGYAESN